MCDKRTQAQCNIVNSHGPVQAFKFVVGLLGLVKVEDDYASGTVTVLASLSSSLGAASKPECRPRPGPALGQDVFSVYLF